MLQHKTKNFMMVVNISDIEITPETARACSRRAFNALMFPVVRREHSDTKDI